MGLLDSVLGAVIQNASQGHGGASAAQGGVGGGLGGLVALAAQNPQLIQAVLSLVSNDGPVGGLPGLMAKFQQAGLGDMIASWLGSGTNQAISGDQLSRVADFDVGVQPVAPQHPGAEQWPQRIARGDQQSQPCRRAGRQRDQRRARKHAGPDVQPEAQERGQCNPGRRPDQGDMVAELRHQQAQAAAQVIRAQQQRNANHPVS